MYYECCVCKTSRQDAILYRFPCSEKRLHMWLKCLAPVCDNLKELSPQQISNLFVCQKHFEQRFITQSSRSRLLGRAYPTLFTEEEMSSGQPSRDDAENVDPQAEHSYSRKRHFDHTYAKLAPLRVLSQNIDATTSSLLGVPGTSQQLPAIQDPVLPVNTGAAASGHLDLPGTSQQLPKGSNSGLNKARCVYKQSSKARKRLVHKLKNMTPAGLIYKEYKKVKNLAIFRKRAQRALRFTKEKAFEKLTKHMNPYARILMKMQINLCMKNKKGRRYTEQEKLIALSILKQSPKCYRFLQKIFILPSQSTLNKMISKLSIGTGIGPQVFDLMKKEVATWDEKKKMCSLIFDEMALETALTYNKHKDSIDGFVELNEKKKQFADHALVFMLRGAVYKWQQPIAFYYCQGSTSGADLKNILREVVAALVECGLKPICLICDQGSSFQSALKSFREETKREQILANEQPDGTVTISGVNLSIIYDPSHFIKGLRNNFLNKDIIMEGKISKWSDIVDVYETDCRHAETRLLHKLNDQHVIPEKIKKMKNHKAQKPMFWVFQLQNG